MKAIKLESFRSLGDTGFVDLRPLTVLVGRNSSGKSSFLRFLPLLRQSIEARTTGPIQWYGDYVDYGGFKETVSSFSSENEIRFGFRLNIEPEIVEHRFYPAQRYHPHDEPAQPRTSAECELTLKIIPDPKDNSVTRFRAINLEAAGHRVQIDMQGLSGVNRIVINGKEPLRQVYEDLRLRSNRLLPQISRDVQSKEFRDVAGRLGHPLYARPLALMELKDELGHLFHHNTTEHKILTAALMMPFGTDQELLRHLREYKESGVHWTRAVRALRIDTPQFRRIRDMTVANYLAGIMEEVDRQLGIFALGVRYVKPVRATAERYYRQQDLAVEEVDPEGRNVAMFIRSLTDAERRDFQRWTSDELGWRIEARIRGGHVSLRIREEGDVSYNLTDVGFGFSQVLPLLAQLWAMQRRGRGRGFRRHVTFAIEQPELHLHPALQARLADVVTGAITSATRRRIGLRVVMETHSEAIVNRIGHQIATGRIEPEAAAVVLFEGTEVGSGSQVRIATFDERGYLQNWPLGFFEAE